MNNTETILSYLESGRLLRRKWAEGPRGPDGYERACLLVALAPECAEDEDVSACTADVMPAWLAHLTPWMDDAGTEAAWPAMVRRYADLAGRWHVLDDAAWRRALLASLLAIVTEARSHATGDEASACDTVIGLLREQAPAGDARWAAWAARDAARDAAADAAAWAERDAEAEAEAVDRITAGILDAIEAEIRKAGA